ncbi:MAG: hypothetical protein PVF65_12570, partial [Sphingomonadales bacterium]
NYFIRACPEKEYDEDGEALPAEEQVYSEYLVEVSGRDLVGFKANLSVGAVISDIYRLEAEFSHAEDRTKLMHKCPGLQRTDSQILKRKAMGMMVNVGGYLPGWNDFRPFSMVGMGALYTRDQFASKKVRYCYQWVTGIEAPLDHNLKVCLQHRYRKAFRADSLHCAEIGLKFSV